LIFNSSSRIKNQSQSSLNINNLDQDTNDSDNDALKNTDNCNHNKAKFSINRRKNIDKIARNWLTKLENKYFKKKCGEALKKVNNSVSI
jgi:hypothetical protein